MIIHILPDKRDRTAARRAGFLCALAFAGLVSGGCAGGWWPKQPALHDFEAPRPPQSQVRTLPVGGSPFSIGAFDLNRDGIIDLVAANHASNDISVLFGSGQGGFASELRLPAGQQPVTVAAADLNRDGILDLVVANAGSDDVCVLAGLPNGAYRLQGRYAVGHGPYALAVNDLNGDERPDLVASNYFSDDVSVLLGRGDGSFESQQRFPATARPVALAVVDMNNDRRPDIATSSALAEPNVYLIGRGDGQFTPGPMPLTSAYLAAFVTPLPVIVSDLNRDGQPDLITANFLTNFLTVLLQ